MNNATIQGFRMMHEDMKASVVITKLSAREMAQLQHSLSKTGDLATLPNGDVYIWDPHFEQWSMWKKGGR
jgi:hypothetical protein